MQIHLYNTLTRQKDPLTPINPGKISLYTCGPTVYNFAHIGNLRTYLFEDILVRTLRHFDYDVKHVMNITDVGHLESDADEGRDKLALASQREQKSPWEIAKYYEKAFFHDTEALHITLPNIICRATEHIPDIINFIKCLEDRGFTYTVDGNVYYRIKKFSHYTDLAKRDLDNLIEGARVEIDPRKENPLDFVLWFSKSKFPNQIMKWDSPWGVGFPGWHIECSVMASKYLGEHIDIHCGGIDHIPVHHTNEIAQSEGCFGHRWVNVWLHGEFLVLAKEKMSKSLGNFITLKSLTDTGFDPLHYRYLCFTAHYRSQLFFSEEALTNARNTFEGLKNRVISWKLNPKSGSADEAKIKAYSERFWTAMADDLNTPVALSVVWEMVKDEQLSTENKYRLMTEFDEILGFDIGSFQRPQLSEPSMQLIHEREQARSKKDWTRADELRQQLLSEGVQIKDTAEGTDWYLVYKD